MNLIKQLAVLLTATLFIAGCDDDDDNIMVPAVVQTNFDQKYPNALGVEWESDRMNATNYLKAEFKEKGIETEVWYTFDGTWVRTETDFYGELPKPVSDYITSKYPNYIVDDMNWVETPEKNFFEIDLEKGESEIELTIMEDGTFLNAVPDLD